MSYLTKSTDKKSKKKNPSVTTDTLGVSKEALYSKRSMAGNSFIGGGKSAIGRRSGTK